MSDMNPENQPPQRQYLSAKAFAYMLLSCVAIIICGYLFFKPYLLQKLDQKPAENVHDLESAFMIGLQTTIANATSTETKAKAERAAGIVSMRLGDISGGYALLRKIAANASYPGVERALAVQLMGDVFLNRTNQDYAFAQSYVFVDAPYEQMPSSIPTDGQKSLQTGIFELYSHASSIKPIPIPAYRLAEFYSRAALLTQDGDERKEALIQAKRQWDKGNALLKESKYAPDSQDNFMEGYALRLRALVAGRLGKLTGDKMYHEDMIQSFESARSSLRKAATLGQVVAPAIELLWTDLHYAQSLASQDKDSDRSKIKNVLDEMLKYVRYGEIGLVGQLRRVANGETVPSIGTKAEIQVLFGFNPQFDTFLKGVGFKER